MEVVYRCCCGIDVHKKVIVPPQQMSPQKSLIHLHRNLAFLRASEAGCSQQRLPAELSYNNYTSQLLHLEKFIFYFV